MNIESEDNWYEDISFCVDVAYVEYKVKAKLLIRKHAVLMLKNKSNKKTVVHPLTAFIHWKWKYKEYNTQRLQAIHLAQFLNFIIIEMRNTYKLKSLSELKYHHGTDFLNHLLIKGRSNKSVKNVELTLDNFYLFLIDKNCLIPLNSKSKRFNPMYSKEFAYDTERGKTAIEHTLPPRLIMMFLRTAMIHSPTTVLGIYFSIFGGLRAGEIVNIRNCDLTPYGDEYGKGGLLVNLNTHNLRTDIKDTSGTSRVKRDRKQFVYSVDGMLPKLYKKHLDELQKKLADNFKNDSPLFINRDGKALTGKSLRDAFNKVKNKFLGELSTSQNPDDVITAINLRSTKWSFHIGRGTFTNLLAKKAKNPYDIALPRGDKSILSSLTYMSDTEEMKNNIQELIQNIYKNE